MTAALRIDLRIAVHLAGRQLRATHRPTALGWLWPLLRTGAQLAVFTVVFSSVFDTGIDDYAAHVFVGIVAYGAILTGLPAAAASVVQNAPLLRRPGFPTHVLPASALLVAGAEVVVALPLLVATGIVADGVAARLLLVVPLLVLQLVLMLGPAALLAFATVFVRDVVAGLGVALMLLMYATPVFYDTAMLPDTARTLVEANPATALVELWRAVVLGDPLPGAGQIAGLLGVALAAGAAAAVLHRRRGAAYLDEL